MPTQPNTNSVAIASRLLATNRSRPEDNIRQDISRILDALAVENIMTYPTTDGPADIYLPRRRIIIETKKQPLASDPHKAQARENDESPFEQLERYILAEIQHELTFPDIQGPTDRPWTAILTDGQTWHAWRYPHKNHPQATPLFANWRPSSPQHLLSRIQTLTSDDPIGKPWIPPKPANLFRNHLPALQDILNSLSGLPMRHAETKRRLWLDTLRSSGIAPENPNRQRTLFTTHSFLVAIARGLVQTLTTPSRDPDNPSPLSEGFPAWIIQHPAGMEWSTQLLDQIHAYEWRRTPGDVLRSLYEAFISQEDRKIFGEYYTPDWLAELLTTEILDDEWCAAAITDSISSSNQGLPLQRRGVLDPACGSGTFLYHAANRILQSPAMRNQLLNPTQKATITARLINGIDVHPVAVEIARATVMRALPTAPMEGIDGIQIHQGDSLRAHSEHDEGMYSHSKHTYHFTTPKGREILLPRSFSEPQNFPNNIRRLVDAAQRGQPVPQDLLLLVPERDRSALTDTCNSFADAIAAEGNSIWAWYVVNITAPMRLSERKVDRILANPPWVSMSGIQDPRRKRELEAFYKRMKLWAGGKQAPHNDIAALFPSRCRQLYLATPESDSAAWLVKKACLSGQNWEPFRQRSFDAVRQVLDLQPMQPFGGGGARRCVALLEHRTCSNTLQSSHERVILSPVAGTKSIRPHDRLPGVLRQITCVPAPPPIPRRESPYLRNGFRQGATIVPACLTLISTADRSADGTADVTTSRSTKHPWSQIEPLHGHIPTQWIRPFLPSTNLLVFSLRPCTRECIVPTDANGDFSEFPPVDNAFWDNAERHYANHRSGGKNTPKTLLRNIDHNNHIRHQLTAQATRTNRTLHTVLYPASADNMCATRTTVTNHIIGHKLYYFHAASPQEAAYLTTILNAPSLQAAFAQSRSSGRDFTLSPWRHVPIPRFNPRNPLHLHIADLCTEGERLATEWLAGNDTAKRSHGWLRNQIRNHIRENGLADHLDAAMTQLLPDQSRP